MSSWTQANIAMEWGLWESYVWVSIVCLHVRGQRAHSGKLSFWWPPPMNHSCGYSCPCTVPSHTDAGLGLGLSLPTPLEYGRNDAVPIWGQALNWLDSIYFYLGRETPQGYLNSHWVPAPKQVSEDHSHPSIQLIPTEQNLLVNSLNHEINHCFNLSNFGVVYYTTINNPNRSLLAVF